MQTELVAFGVEQDDVVWEPGPVVLPDVGRAQLGQALGRRPDASPPGLRWVIARTTGADVDVEAVLAHLGCGTCWKYMRGATPAGSRIEAPSSTESGDSPGTTHHCSHEANPGGGGSTSAPHVLRHTVGTALVRGGQDLVLVADLMGHALLKTTRGYALPTAEDRQRAINGLPTDRSLVPCAIS